MKISVIKNPLLILLQDGQEAETLLASDKERQFVRRVYIINLISFVEGSIAVLKNALLQLQRETKHPIMTLAECALLREENFDLKDNAQIKISRKVLKIPDNLRFTMGLFNRLFKGDIDLKTSGQIWQDLKSVVSIRNRITHPRDASSIEVEDEELASAQRVSSWFNDVIHDVLILLTQKPPNDHLKI